jgi:hypothetical protein
MCITLGDTDAAKRLVENIRPDSGAQLAMMAGISEIFALSGESGEARKIATGLNLFAPDSSLGRYRQALLSIALGDKERALALLEDAIRMREPELVWIGVEPRFDSLRTESAFGNVVREVIHRSM